MFVNAPLGSSTDPKEIGNEEKWVSHYENVLLTSSLKTRVKLVVNTAHD